MSPPTRRSLLRTGSGLLAGVALAGCSNLSSITDTGETTSRETATDEPTQTTIRTRTETKTSTKRTATTPDEPTENGTGALRKPKDSLKISKVAANPKGRDSEHLNHEIVTLEAWGTEPINATGYTLEYDTSRKYTFPKFTSDLPRGTTIEVHSGPGENGVDASAPPEYALFVGSETPLLNNGGETLVLRNPNGTVVQKVSYPALNEGVPYVLPESPATVTPQDKTTRSTAKPTETSVSKADNNRSGPHPIGDLNPSQYDSIAKVRKAVSFDLPTVKLPAGYTFARAAVAMSDDTANTNQEYVALIYANRSSNSITKWAVVYIVHPQNETNFDIGQNVSIGNRTGAYYGNQLLFVCHNSEYEISGPFTRDQLVQIAKSICTTR